MSHYNRTILNNIYQSVITIINENNQIKQVIHFNSFQFWQLQSYIEQFCTINGKITHTKRVRLLYIFSRFLPTSQNGSQEWTKADLRTIRLSTLYMCMHNSVTYKANVHLSTA